MSQKLRAGDLVEIRSAEEILATLDESGCVSEMPFMPEMLPYIGKRLRVVKRAHKTCDTIHKTGARGLHDCVHLEEVRCDGAAHGGCDASCSIFWKTDWLRPVAESAPSSEPATADSSTADSEPLDKLRNLVTGATSGTASAEGENGYSCQATRLYKASYPLKWWQPRHYIEDIVSRNWPVRHMWRVWFFHGLHKLMGIGVCYRVWLRIYNALQPRSGGHLYPFHAGDLPFGAKTPAENLGLQPGERVRVKSHEEILATLDEAKMNRGMLFGPEMVPYCEKEFTVSKRVNRLINENSGIMLDMKTPGIILDGVICRSEFSDCRLFCPRAITPYWREIWLERVQ